MILSIFILIVRIITVVVFFWSARLLLQNPSAENWVSFLGAITGFIITFIIERIDKKSDLSKPDKNYTKILNTVLTDSKGKFISRLDATLAEGVRAELGLEYAPEAAQEKAWYSSNQLPQKISDDKDILTIFYEAQHQQLLIIGIPGAGKTTAMLRLGLLVAEKVEKQKSESIPVLFELSRWAQKPEQNIRSWLASELRNLYQSIPIEEWEKLLNPENPRIIPLLDGFDEVSVENQEACLAAIKDFAKDAAIDLVICSRIHEYQQLQNKLNMNAVEIRELTEYQIVNYLEAFGTETVELQALLMQDDDLLDLAKTPLLLNILVLAYRGKDNITDFQNADSDEERRKALFARYINERFKTKPAQENPPHTQDETLKWLHWLAWQMEKRDKMQQFEIEGLQPDWLRDEKLLKNYIWRVHLSVELIKGLIFGVLAALLGTLLGTPIAGLIAGLFIGLIFGLFIGLIATLIYGLGGALVGWLSSLNDTIEPVEQLRWSWSAAVGGLLGGLIFGVLVTWIAELFGAQPPWQLIGLIVGSFFGLFTALSEGFKIDYITVKQQANEGIKRSFRNYIQMIIINGMISGLYVGLVAGLIFGLIFGLFIGLIFGLYVGLIAGLIFGLTIGLDIGQDKGGLPVFQHIVLREMLYRQGVMPRNYARFLDYCVRLRLLVRVGGSYKFLHRLLQEHFAAEYENTTP